jgi:CRISPR-associated protein Csb2
MTYLLLTVRWLDGRYHGLLSRDGPPEWPPSPYRLFQALVSAVARRGELDSALGESLRWLQTLKPPTIVAPRTRAGQIVTCFVPNNDGDKKPDRQNRLKGKTFRPTLIIDRPEIHYLWPVDVDCRSQAQLACQAARYLTCLGWGIDTACADGRLIGTDEAGGLVGIRWHPREGITQVTGLLRVPVFDHETKENTLDDLRRAHQSALNRVNHGKPLNSVEKPRTFDRVFYHCGTNPAPRVYSAFALLRLDVQGFRSFDTVRRARCVAGMVRHLVSQAANDAGWANERIMTFVHGHSSDGNGPARSEDGLPRFSYLPLPTIEGRGPKSSNQVVGSIRRVLVVGPPSGIGEEVAWARRALSGQQLINEETQEPEALLSLVPNNDRRVRHYTDRSSVWTTVTPVVLPGYDDPRHLRRKLSQPTGAGDQKRLLERIDARIDGLLRKAIRQAGFSEELARDAEIDWRATGFLPGVDLASRYCVPAHLKRFSRYHVKIAWRDSTGKPISLSGPIAIGGGRFGGFGLFVGIDG